MRGQVPAFLALIALAGCGDDPAVPAFPTSSYDVTVLTTSTSELVTAALNDAGQAVWSTEDGQRYWNGQELYSLPYSFRDLGPDGTIALFSSDSAYVWREGDIVDRLAGWPMGIADATGKVYFSREDQVYTWTDGEVQAVQGPRGVGVVGEDGSWWGRDVESADSGELYGSEACWIWRDGEKVYVVGARNCSILDIAQSGWVLYDANLGGRVYEVWANGEVFRVMSRPVSEIPKGDLNSNGTVLTELTLTEVERGEQTRLDSLGIGGDWVLHRGGQLNNRGQILLSAHDSVANEDTILLLTLR